MKNFLRQSLAKKVILFAFLVGLVSPSAMAYVDGGYPIGTSKIQSTEQGLVKAVEGHLVAAVAPSVQNLNVSTATGSATVSFSLNTTATATVWIKDTTDTIVKTLIFDNNLSGGTVYSYNWNGTNNNGQSVANGSYKAQVVVYNTVSSAIQNASFNFTSGSVSVTPVVSISAYPSTFNTSNGESTTVSYNLNTTASLGVNVKSGGSVIRTLRAQSNQTAGSYQLVWDGRNSTGTVMSPGTYTIEVYATNSAGNDTATTQATITNNPVEVAPVVSVNVSPSSFDPSEGETTLVSYTLNTPASLRVEVKQNGTVVKTLRTLATAGAGSASLSWNGSLNGSSSLASVGTYNVEVYATNTAGTDLDTDTVTVTKNNVIVVPVVSISASPSSFNPSNGQTTTVSYTLNTPASLRVEVKQNGTVLKTLRALAQQTAGSYTLTWDGGINSSNTQAPVGTYTIEVYATNTAGSDTESTSVNITSGTNLTAPNVTGLYATPTPFNPNNENTRVYFTTDKTADVTVTILNGSSTVKNLVSGASLSAGTYYYEWNGRDSNGNMVSDQTYTARVTASNTAGSDTESTSVQVNTSGNSTCDIVTSHYVNPTTFDPESRDAQINYNLSRTAEVTVRIKDGSSTIKTLLDHQTQNSGSRYISWNGRESDGSYADDGYYTYEISGYVSGCSTDTESSSVRVDRDGNDDDDDDDWGSTDEDLITDVIVRNEVFDPTDGERSTVEFTLARRADLKVQVMDGNTVVKTLRDTSDQAAGDYSYTWDGRDSDGDIMSDDVYQFRIMADDGDDTDTDRAYVEVDTDGIIIGFPDSDRCAGYRDVSINSPFCKAIELMTERGIFEGYSDGTFRPYARINRAETVKVITLALGYSVNAGGTYNLGYSDTSSSAWYSPYLYVAKREGIATGYPDNSFRPSTTINRVELLRVFLEGNQTDLYTCNTQPYDDTPITRDTRWYMKYACYAKDNDLMNSGYNNNLYPAEAMTRGDVAELFYDFEVKGLYSDFVLSRTGNYYNRNNNTRVCVQYSTNGSCSRYEYTTDSYNTYHCVEYDNNDRCVRYSRTSSSNYNNSSSDGYYVYRDGRYVWVSY